MSGDVDVAQGRTSWQWVSLVLLGLGAGFLSGMFGVGGGILIVPGLIMIEHFTQKMASGTSLAAIVPLAAVGVLSYAVADSVAWVAAIFLAVGAMVGSRIGTWLLAIVKPRPLQVIFSTFMVLVIISLFLVVPDRDASFVVTPLSALTLILLGVVTGVLSGLLGVGGGVIIVPALMFFFGTSDLVAKGTSLLVMIPSALVGTFFNARNRNVDLPAALTVGVSASATTYLGSVAAQNTPAEVANMFFAMFLGVVALQMFVKAVRKPKPGGHADAD